MCTIEGGLNDARDAFLKRLGISSDTARKLAQEIRRLENAGSGSFPNLKTLLRKELGDEEFDEALEEGTITIQPGDMTKLTELFASDV